MKHSYFSPLAALIPTVSLGFLLLSCGSGSSGGTRTVVSQDASVAGSLIIQLEPKEGADPSTVSRASLEVEGHPEISGTADATGRIEVTQILPGTLNVIVTSDSGSGLNLSGESAYGLKLDDIVITAGKANNLGTKTLQETGSFQGTVGFLTNSEIDPEGTLVYIPGTSFSAHTDANGKFALGGLPPGTYDLSFQRDGFAVTKLKDVEIQEGAVTDLGPVTLSLALGPEGGIAVANGQAVTIGSKEKTLITARSVDLAISYDSDAVLMKIGKDPAFLNQSWEPVAATKSLEFDSEGEHSVYVMFADLNGLESSAYNVSFVIDTLAPVLNEISILNGWSQSAPTSVYVTANVTDEGSGIAQIRFSNTSATLADATWQTYTQLNLWNLTEGTGGKTVYAQVKDYAGNVSEIVDDGIVVGSETIIYGTTYQEDVTLQQAFGPYYIESDTTFAGNLTIEPGTVVTIKNGVTVKLKGQLQAQGNSGNPIIVTNSLDPTMGCNEMGNDYAILDMTEAAPGVTEKSRVEYVEFRYLAMKLNGGLFKNSKFASENCGSNFGSITKTGLDRLTLNKVNFVNHRSIYVQSGNGLTLLQESTGDFGEFMQSALGSNTVFKDNSFTIATSDVSSGLIRLDKGVSFTGTNTFTFAHASDARVLFYNEGTSTVKISGIVVNDTNDTCRTLIYDGAQNNLTIERSTIECRTLFIRAATPNNTGVILFDRNILRMSRHLANLSSSGGVNLKFTRNDIRVQGTASLYGRLFTRPIYQFYTGSIDITMQQNKILCDTASYCYGFYAAQYYSASPSVQTIYTHLDIDSNYWEGLAMNPNLDTNVIRRSNTDMDIYGDETEHVFYEFDVGYNSNDYINHTIDLEPYTNLATAPTVGPSAP